MSRSPYEPRMHRCSWCGGVYPATEEYFYPAYYTDGNERRAEPGYKQYGTYCKGCLLTIHARKHDAGRVRDEDLMTFEQIGKELGVSKQYAKRIYDQAMAKLRRRLDREAIRELLEDEPLVNTGRDGSRYYFRFVRWRLSSMSFQIVPPRPWNRKIFFEGALTNQINDLD